MKTEELISKGLESLSLLIGLSWHLGFFPLALHWTWKSELAGLQEESEAELALEDPCHLRFLAWPDEVQA